MNKTADKLKTLQTNPEEMNYRRKVAITTLGCKVNQCESAALAEDLQRKNFLLVPFSSAADVYIINTCTVTSFSDFQSRQLIHRAHRANPRATILVTGCYAQIAAPEIEVIEGVSFIVGNDRKHQIADLLQGNLSATSDVYAGNILRKNKFQNMPAAGFQNRTRAFLKIQDGCSSFCSYCIIPYARGRNRSLPPPAVLQNVEQLNQKNYKEIVLTGIHLGSYGYDLNPPTKLSSLLYQLLNQYRHIRFRLSSIEPNEITDELIDLFYQNDNLCPHLHIPLQSGDNEILKLMKRKYDTHFYGNLIEKVCRTIDDIAVGVDVMTGFPSESEKQFKNTFHLLDDLPIAYLHVFPYSERPGTAAQKIEPKIPQAIKKERAALLRDLSAKKREKYALRFLGKPLQVLVEKTKDKKTGMAKGFSQNYLPFLLTGDSSSLTNTIVTAQADKYFGERLYGTIIQ